MRLIAAALTLDLWWASRHHEAKAPAALFAPGPLSARLAASHDRAFVPPWIGPIHGTRTVRSLEASYAARARGLSPNVGLGEGVRNAHGYEPLAPAASWTLFGGWNGEVRSVADGLRAAGVRWLIGPAGRPTALPGWPVRARVAGVWELREAPSFVPPVRVVAEAAAAVAWHRIADAPLTGAASITGSSWNTLSIAMRTDHGGRLLTGWFDLPGWIARDAAGRRLPVGPAGRVFQSVPVPAGVGAVRLTYAPLTFALGLLLGTLVLGTVVARAALR